MKIFTVGHEQYLDRVTCVLLIVAFATSFIWTPSAQTIMVITSIFLSTLALLVRNPARLAQKCQPGTTSQAWTMITLIFFMLWVTIRAITSEIPALSLAQLAVYLLPGFVVLTTIIIQEDKTVHHLQRAFHLIITGLAGITMISAILPDTTTLFNSIGRAQWPFENANHLAMVMNAGLITSVVPILGNTPLSKKIRWFFILSGLMCGIALMMTGSRGGLIGLGAAIFTFLCLRPTTIQKIYLRPTQIKITLIILTIFLGIVMMTPAGLIAITGFTQFITHPDHAMGSRPALWLSTIDLITHHPIIGYGTGTFVAVFPQVMTPEHLTSAYAAHNDFLQIILETGLIGGGLYLLLAGLTLCVIYKIRHAQQAVLAGPLLVALGVHAQIEFMWGVLPVLILTGFAWGLLLRTAMQQTHTTHTNHQTSSTWTLYYSGQLILLFSLVVALTSMAQIYAENRLQKADRALQNRDIHTYANLLDTARAFSFNLHAGPYIRAADFHLLLFLSGGGDQAPSATEIQNQLDQARLRNPYSPALYEIQGRFDQAQGKSPVPAWTTGLNREPRSASLRLALLQYHEQLGHGAEIDHLIIETNKWPALKGPINDLNRAIQRYEHDKNPSD